MFETAVEEIRQDNLAAARPISWEAAGHNLRASPFKLPFLLIFIGPKYEHCLQCNDVVAMNCELKNRI